MQIIYTGQTLSDSDFLGNALVNGDEFNVDLVSASPTLIELRNPSNGWETTVTGSGFAIDGDENPTAVPSRGTRSPMARRRSRPCPMSAGAW